MSDSPERIIVAKDFDGLFVCRAEIPGSHQYIRADIAERQLAEARAETETVKLAQEANHNLAVANGNRAKEEYERAEAAKAERDRLAADIVIVAKALNSLTTPEIKWNEAVFRLKQIRRKSPVVPAERGE